MSNRFSVTVLGAALAVLTMTSAACTASAGSAEPDRDDAARIIKSSPEFSKANFEIPVTAGEFCRGTDEQVFEPVQFLPPRAGGLEVGNGVVFGLIEVDWRQVSHEDMRAGTAPKPCVDYYNDLMSKGVGGSFTFHASKHFYWKVTVTPKGRAVGLTDSGGVAKLGSREVLKVTGLSPNSDGTILVEFRSYMELTPQAKAAGFAPFGAGEGRPATVSLRRYDDGWRIVPGTMKVS
ncbi:MAG TPA: hypothetical protein VD998_00130 [Verrucomicrobiae bacterium]|nr:hypothetical protein [Verrucomicrobiae bacterium]